ncbi:MAG: hexokinase [Balneolaceae bacterium]|nr:MAG: hexokinase [Balneolaceae bacterium]
MESSMYENKDSVTLQVEPEKRINLKVKITKMNTVQNFLAGYKLRAEDIDMDSLVGSFTSEMEKGLNGEDSSLRMIATYIEADNEFLIDTPVLAIDAGGTNFRAALVTFKADGNIDMGEIIHKRMPGLEGEISASEFFNTMAGFIRDLAKQTDKIGFCFSYATEMYPNKDGKLLNFSKEVQAPEVIGKMIGKSLLEALGMPEKEIVILNDTVATLLAGKSASIQKTYDSFIGFILGTGTNTSYIEKNSNILKKPELDQDKSQIINIESGNFGRAQRSAIDIQFDNTTATPGNYTFEKMFSGGYFGGLCLAVLKEAANEEVFSVEASQKLENISTLTSEQANQFLKNSSDSDNVLGGCFTTDEDISAARTIIENMINRASKLVAGNLAAVLLKTGKGTEAGKPVLITIEGTTFYKLQNLKNQFEDYFYGYLADDKKRFAEFTYVEQSSLIGAALAGLIEN